MNEVPINPIN